MRAYLLLWIAVFGCSSAPPIGEPATGAAGGASGGDASGSIVLGAGGQKPAATTPTIDQNCGNSASTMTPVPADLLLVLDRSGSMTNDIGRDEPCDTTTGACSERWATMG